MKRTCILTTIAALTLLTMNTHAQSYLPLTGGELTGNLAIASGSQIQAPYYGFDAPAAQPSNSLNVAMFPNSTVLAFDFVGYGSSWRFIPVTGSAYPSPVVSFDQSGNGSFSGILISKGVTINGASIFYGGNVLIGKTTQTNTSYVLDVGGNVRANQVVVNTTGADFVFDPIYHLSPLDSLDAFVRENHHLPGVPCAQKMQTDGINVGDNQTLLLQKMEELTLYMIQLEKENQALKKRIDQLESKP